MTIVEYTFCLHIHTVACVLFIEIIHVLLDITTKKLYIGIFFEHVVNASLWFLKKVHPLGQGIVQCYVTLYKLHFSFTNEHHIVNSML